MGDAWLKANSAIALLAWPLMAGAVALAGDLIPVVFGAQWLPAVVPFQVLCGLMAVQAVAATANTVLMAHGRADLLLRASIASALVIAAALWLGTHHGITGVAVGYALAGTASALTYTGLAAHVARVPVASLLQDLRPWAFAAIVTGLLISGVHALAGQAAPGTRLALGLATGLASYPAMLWLLARQRTRGLLTDVGGRLFQRGDSVKL